MQLVSSVVDKIEILTNASSIEELWAAHVEIMDEYGFDRLIYGFTRYRSEQSLGDPQDWVILSNQTQQYMEEFIYSGIAYHAPMLRWALNNDGACSWGVMEEMAREQSLTERELKVIEFNKIHDVTAGYTISFRTISRRSKGAISLNARRGLSQLQVDVIWQKHGREIMLLNNITHLKILSLPYFGSRQLTRRQREVLGWVGDGKTTQDIAVLLGLTPATVEKHLRLAREKLDVETTAQAVLKASFYNQMFIFEDPE